MLDVSEQFDYRFMLAQRNFYRCRHFHNALGAVVLAGGSWISQIQEHSGDITMKPIRQSCWFCQAVALLTHLDTEKRACGLPLSVRGGVPSRF